MQEEMMFMSLDHILIECIILQIKFHSILSKAFSRSILMAMKPLWLFLHLWKQLRVSWTIIKLSEALLLGRKILCSGLMIWLRKGRNNKNFCENFVNSIAETNWMKLIVSRELVLGMSDKNVWFKEEWTISELKMEVKRFEIAGRVFLRNFWKKNGWQPSGPGAL